MLKKQYQKNKSTCKVTFTLSQEALEAKEVRLLGEFNNWNWEEGVTMKAQKGEFTAVVELPVGRNYQFRYLADNGVWMNDAKADSYLATPFGIENSVVFVDEVLDVPIKKVTTKKATVKATPAKKTATKKVVAEKATTIKKVVAKATPAKKDNLTKIEGIGPKIATLLAEANIITFQDLSEAKLTVLENVLLNAGPRFKMHKPTTWAEQATLAAKGDWDTLKKLQDELDGGKRK